MNRSHNDRRSSHGERTTSLFDGETHARVLDHGSKGPDMIIAITERDLRISRLKAVQGSELKFLGDRVSIDSSSELISEIIGLTRISSLSPSVLSELPEIIASILRDAPERCLGFYNRAGPLSLKMHSYELLPGIGSKKAQEMVEARGRTGWTEISALDEACNIDSANLLANRLIEEMNDEHLQPRLLDLLFRTEV